MAALRVCSRQCQNLPLGFESPQSGIVPKSIGKKRFNERLNEIIARATAPSIVSDEFLVKVRRNHQGIFLAP